jgi:hypothetical protein
VVYGMPKEAVKRGAVRRDEVALDHVGPGARRATRRLTELLVHHERAAQLHEAEHRPW